MNFLRKIIILRLGHRQFRDKRITTHLGLVGRAFGADGMVIADTSDSEIENSIKKINQRWGGDFFIETNVSHTKFLKLQKEKGSIIVHLTMYGEVLDDTLIKKIKDFQKDIIIVVGSQKVPREIYELATYNISISNQPHSEVAALAIFLDRFYEGKQFTKKVEGAKFEIIPSKKGKNVKRL
ncbi:MAG: tRNA (cytidine(56)-2'-O)-methyltransferase [Candidatus Helarchaeota archaeon]